MCRDLENVINEEGQNWAKLREDAEKLAALNGKTQVVNIQSKELYFEVVKILKACVCWELKNPKPSHNDYERGAVTLQKTYFFWTPKQFSQPQKQAF